MRYLLIAFFLFAATAQAAPQKPQPDPNAVPNPAFAAAQKGDWVQGNPNAKVTVTEYASLSCPHCAHFQMQILPDIFKKYVDTNKVQFISRDFPLNAPALKAAVLLRCTPEASRHDFMNKLYQTQNKWAYDKDYVLHLQTLALENNMTKKQFRKCMDDKKLEEAVVKSRMDGVKQLNVGGTPTLYVNGERYMGSSDADGLSAVIEKYLAK